MTNVIEFKPRKKTLSEQEEKFEEVWSKIARVYEAHKHFNETGKCGYCNSENIALTGNPCYYAHCNDCNHITGDDPNLHTVANIYPYNKVDSFEKDEIMIVLLGIFAAMLVFIILS
jgi:hypothetical protein